MPGGPPAGMPPWAVTLYWLVVALIAALGVSAPFVWRGYQAIRGDLRKVRTTGHELASSATVIGVASQFNAQQIVEIRKALDGEMDAKIRSCMVAALSDPGTLSGWNAMVHDAVAAGIADHERRLHDVSSDAAAATGIVIPGSGSVAPAVAGDAPRRQRRVGWTNEE